MTVTVLHEGMERLERADATRMMDPRRPDPLECTRYVHLEIRMPCKDAKQCRALLEALKPDDKTAPPWLRIIERVDGETLVVEIEAPVARIMSARQTADEIIEYAYSLLRSLEKLGGFDEKRSPS